MTRRYLLLPILILWLAFGLRLYKIDSQSIWWDEGHSIFVAGHPVLQIPTLPAMDVHPPLYFALLHGWMMLAGHSEFAVRYLSLLFGMLLVALLWRFAAILSRFNFTPSNSPSRGGGRNFPPREGGLRGVFTVWRSAAVLAALFTALSPLYVAYSQEVRSYTMITFLATASTLALWQLIVGIPQSQVDVPHQPPARFISRHAMLWLAVYILLTTACLYTHYFIIFLLIFHTLVWLIWLFCASYQPLSQRLVLWLMSQLGILLLFAPQLLLAVRQITGYTNPNLNPPNLGTFIQRSWQAYTVGLTINPTPARWGMAAMAILLVFTWLVVLNRARKIQNSQRRNQTAKLVVFCFLTAWFFIPLAAYYLVLQRQPSFEPRYLILATPPLFLLLALGLAQLSPPHHLQLPSSNSPTPNSQLPTPNSLLPLFIFAIALHSYYTNPTYFKDDSAGVAAWLAAETTPNDIVYVDVPHPFHYYVERQSIPAATQYLFVDVHTATAILNQTAAGKARLFWITWWGSDTDPRGVIPFLAQKAGQPAGQRDFKGYHAQWFNLPPNAIFSLPTDLTPQSATFGDVLRLDGAAFGAGSTLEPIWATLHFSLLRDTDINYKVSLRLRNETGEVVAQQDRDLLNDRHFRTAAWPLADAALNQAINVYTILPPAPDNYRLEVVVYNAQPPYPSEGVSGHQTTDGASAILGQVIITP